MSDNAVANADSNASGDDGSYVVVARRYRPRSFDELVGQEHVGRALRNAIETGRVGHAYLFTGARGVGKTSTARIFAKALNNPSGPNADLDNDSDIAQAIDSGEDIDVIEIDGASNRGIDEIRSLRANVGVRPSRSRYKIYIIDEVHMLTTQAFNALLKTLEEPPEHVKFIFCTTDPEKLPITVLSRCQRFDFAPVEVPKIVQRLREIVTAENAQADDAALELVARRAAGSMRDSQSLLEQVLSFSDGNLTAEQVHSMLGTADDERLHALAMAMADRDAAAVLTQLDTAIDAGVDAGRIAEQLLGFFRDLMAVSVGCEAQMQRHTAMGLHHELKDLGQRWGLQTVLAVVALLDQTLTRVRHSVYGRVLLEAAVIQICHLPDLQAIADLAGGAKQAGGNVPANATQKKKLAERADPPSTQPAPIQPAPTQPAEPPGKNQASDDGLGNSQASDRPATKIDSAQAAPNAPRQPLTSDSLDQILSAALKTVEPMTASIASMAKAELGGEHAIKFVFPAEASMSMKRMEMPEHRGPVTDAIAQVIGHPVTLQCVAGAATAGVASRVKPTPKPSAKERMERMREIESDPWIQACVTTFQAEIIKVDPKP